MKLNTSLILFLLLISSCKSAEIALSDENKLLKFAVIYNEFEYAGIIDDSAKTVQTDLPWNAYRSDLKFKIEVSPKASYKISDSVDFSKPQTIWVTAQNKVSSQYKLIVSNSQVINLLDERIEIKNCLHVIRDSFKIGMLRFNEQNLAEPRINYLQNGKTQTGILIRFTTNSNFIRVKFTETAGAHWGTDYGVWVDGVWYNNYTSHNFTLQKPAGKDFATWEITPSLMNAVNLTGIEIENGKQFVAPQPYFQRQYYALGNSITQGVGQGNAGYLSYPFLFGRKRAYETYNLAVGGSKVSWKVATELAHRKADLISLLWGYNDWYFVGETPTTYHSNMLALINKIREYQPHTALVCISLIGTENQTPASGVKIEEYRAVVEQLVADRNAAGDKNIYFLDGSTVNVELMDKVHPSVKGAADLAVILEDFVIKTIQE